MRPAIEAGLGDEFIESGEKNCQGEVSPLVPDQPYAGCTEHTGLVGLL